MAKMRFIMQKVTNLNSSLSSIAEFEMLTEFMNKSTSMMSLSLKNYATRT